MKVAIVTTYAHKIAKARQELLSQIRESGCKVTVMGPEDEQLCQPALKKMGIVYIKIKTKRINLNPLKEFIGILDIKKKLKANGIDCVLIYGVRMVPTVVLAAKLAGIRRIVCIINGAGNLFMSSGIRGNLIRLISYPILSFVLRTSESVIFQNKDDFNDFKKRFLVSTHNVTFTNGSGVNTVTYKKAPLPKSLNFLMVSRITGSKGVNEYVNAARVVKKQYSDAQFHLVGPKDDMDASIDWDLIEDAVKKGVIKYHGATDSVYEYLTKCRIFVFPSYYREGVPRAVLEAMAVGRPIITTDSPGCRETVIDGINGLLVPPKNSTVLAEKMIWMIQNPERVLEMAKESRRIATEKFDINVVNNIIVTHLDPSAAKAAPVDNENRSSMYT